MATIELREVVKRYGATEAMSKVSLHIQDGEFLVLLGPSGCGKTTSLRSIAGLEKADEGDIMIDGKRMNDVRPADRDMAFCFQQYALYPHLNAFENIAFPLRTQRVSKAEIEERVGNVGKVLHITDIFKKKPKQLSSGDQQRVALGRAMVRQPKVYLMDEPLSNLDAKLREDMRVVLRRIQIENKTTTVYVTHDQIEAMSMADRIAIMNKGKLLQVGTPEDVYYSPANLFVANFIGSPSMNFIPCTYDAQSCGVTIEFGDLSCTVKLPVSLSKSMSGMKNQSALVLGVRPEDVLIDTNPTAGAIEMMLEVMEPMGSENFFLMERGPIRLRSRKDPSVIYPVNSKVWISFEPAGVHVFDRETENAFTQEG
jgi:multiple sugar transport system ATP-binding protein